MPLSTVLRSIVDSNQRHWPFEFFILHDNFSEALRKKVFRSLPAASAALRWLPADIRLFKDFSQGYEGRISRLTYARILMPWTLPPTVSRVLFFDVDTLVFEDLAPLWQTDLAGAVIGAVPDFLLHTAFLEKGLDPVKERTNHRLPAIKDLPRVTEYFNAGILLIDLDRWREERISEKAYAYLKAHPNLAFADQDALNFALDKRWKPLDPRWNVQNHYPRILPGKGEIGIVHFITAAKPWLPASRSANAGLYDHFRSRTLFARTRREKLTDSLIRFHTGIRRVLKRGFRMPLPSA
jgi:lipopolysaccharide biosynthesis glycosyltransferase